MSRHGVRFCAFALAAISTASSCGGAPPARSAAGGADEVELPDPVAPTDLPDDPGQLPEGDAPLVDPAKEIGRPAASSSTRPPR